MRGVGSSPRCCGGAQWRRASADTDFATTSHYLAESLDVVGGNELHLSSTAPTSLMLEKTIEAGDSEDSKTHLFIWSFSVTPPGSESPGESGSRGAAGRACSPSLTRVAARPSPAHAGKPIIVSFHASGRPKPRCSFRRWAARPAQLSPARSPRARPARLGRLARHDAGTGGPIRPDRAGEGVSQDTHPRSHISMH